MEIELTTEPSPGCGRLWIRFDACRSARCGGTMVVVGGGTVAIGTSVPSCKWTKGKRCLSIMLAEKANNHIQDRYDRVNQLALNCEWLAVSKCKWTEVRQTNKHEKWEVWWGLGRGDSWRMKTLWRKLRASGREKWNRNATVRNGIKTVYLFM